MKLYQIYSPGVSGRVPLGTYVPKRYVCHGTVSLEDFLTFYSELVHLFFKRHVILLSMQLSSRVVD